MMWLIDSDRVGPRVLADASLRLKDCADLPSISQIVRRLFQQPGIFRVLAAAQRHAHLRRRVRAVPLSWERRDSYRRFGRCQNFESILCTGERSTGVWQARQTDVTIGVQGTHAPTVCSSLVVRPPMRRPEPLFQPRHDWEKCLLCTWYERARRGQTNWKIKGDEKKTMAGEELLQSPG